MAHDEDGWQQLATDDETIDSCTLCNGPLAYLGQLGRRTWYRCIACGMEQSSTSST